MNRLWLLNGCRFRLWLRLGWKSMHSDNINRRFSIREFKPKLDAPRRGDCQTLDSRQKLDGWHVLKIEVHIGTEEFISAKLDNQVTVHDGRISIVAANNRPVHHVWDPER